MKARTRALLLLLGTLVCLVTSPAHPQAAPEHEVIIVDAKGPSRPFPHFWEKMFGSGRAILSLRENYRQDLRDVKQITGFKYVRFHAIFHDEVGVYDEDGQQHPTYNFSYVDQIYDGLLANGVKPFVELSFMPRKLAAADALHSFWYKPDVAPPRDWAKWDGLIQAFAEHLVERYGIEEVATWYFEVWNEPNIDFWAGVPKQATYGQLYDHTALAIKKVRRPESVAQPHPDLPREPCRSPPWRSIYTIRMVKNRLDTYNADDGDFEGKPGRRDYGFNANTVPNFPFPPPLVVVP